MTTRSQPPLDNPLLRLLFWNWIAGAIAAVTLLGGLLVTNAMHLRDLIFSSDNPVVPIAMLMFGFLITMCSVAMGTAIMNSGSDDDDRNGGLGAGISPDDDDLLPRHQPVLQPIRVRATPRRPRD
jgi:hypothetical protein